MEENIVSKPHLIKTPVHKIPIGEPVKNPDGHYSMVPIARCDEPSCAVYIGSWRLSFV